MVLLASSTGSLPFNQRAMGFFVAVPNVIKTEGRLDRRALLEGWLGHRLEVHRLDHQLEAHRLEAHRRLTRLGWSQEHLVCSLK